MLLKLCSYFSVSSISTITDGANKRKFIFVGLLGAVCLSLIIIGILIAYNVVTRYISPSSYFCSEMLSIKEKKVILTFYLLKLYFRKREAKKSETVDVEESQYGGMSNVYNNDVRSTEYQELTDRKTQIYENLS